MTRSTSVPATQSPTRRGSSPTPLRAGDVAKALGIGVQTLHYYERERLIPAPDRTGSGYRLYTPHIVARVQFIRKSQALGLSLDEVREILHLADVGSSPCGRVQRALAEKLDEVDGRLRELRAFRRDLAALVARSEALGEARAHGGVCAIVEGVTASAYSPARLTRPLARRRLR